MLVRHKDIAMTRNPPIPPDQRRPHDEVDADTAKLDRRDRRTDAQSGEPGDADVNTDEQGRFGNLAQNVKTTHRRP